MQEMDSLAADLALQAILGRTTDFVGGIDNEALDFSQLEDFINSEGSQSNNTYFGESLNPVTPSNNNTTNNNDQQTNGGKLLNVIVENKRNLTNNNNNNNNARTITTTTTGAGGGGVVTGHSLPESPPDSSSEHPYSPQEGCCDTTQLTTTTTTNDNIYTTLGQTIYKTNLLNPMLSDSLILGSHIVVNEQNNEQLIDNNLLQDTTRLLNNRLLQQPHHHHHHHHQQDDGTNLLQDGRLILTENNVGTPTNVVVAATNNEQHTLYNVNNSNNSTSNVNKSSDDYEKNNHLIHHLNYNHGIDIVNGINHNNNSNNNNNTIDNNNLCESTTQQSQQQTNGLDGNSNNIQTAIYTNLQNVSKKRKLSQDSPLVKSEPEHCTTSQLSPNGQLSTSIDEEYASSEACLSESQYQCIRFNPFQQAQWHSLCDQNLTELPIPHYRVDADKGFNFSNADDAFVCQKKNHFQVTCHVQLLGDAQFVKTVDGFQKIGSFHLHFYGVKHDCPTQTIRVEQSQSDRSKKPFHPVLVELVNSQVTKVTVGRLHFSETTSNNMRKKGKPNPEQRYFQLVVGLHAHTTNGNFPVISQASQKIIVRASNPGQFESDVELCWQKGQTQDSVFHNGKVGINMDRPDESLVVHGNIKVTGHIIQPSDIRAKKNIVECNTAEQLRNVQKLRVVKYDYEPIFASQLSRNTQYSDTGVIAQEVAEILPEAVRPAGNLLLDNGESIDNFLVVNKERIFMENIGAVKELCRVTDNLETRIDQLERINKRLNKLKRGDSLKSNSTVNSSKHSFHTQKCQKHHHKCKLNNDDDELCSNKFIQIVIVVLVLIMAFCLAAITTLYLMENSRNNQFSHNFQSTNRNSNNYNNNNNFITKRPSKNYKTWHTITPYHHTNSFNNDDDITKITIDSNLVKRPSFIIGRPADCLTVEQDLESTNLCQIYCCATPPIVSPAELSIGNVGSTFSDKSNTNHKSNIGTNVGKLAEAVTLNRNNNNNGNKTTTATTTTLLSIEKNQITKPFHTNDIDKQQILRQKRGTYDLNDDTNSFDQLIDDNMFIIIIQGRNFNTTLTQKYLLMSYTNLYNFSYSVPISKYMPDEFINLIFRSTQRNIKEIEHCYNDFNKQRECPYTSKIYDDKQEQQQQQHIRHRVNENIPSQLISAQCVIFEVDMMNFQSKTMTYRVSLRQNQNVCKLSATKQNLEFIEYNFHFYRHCDE